MKRFHRLSVLAALLVLPALCQEAQERITPERLDELVTELSEITGLAKRKAVEYSVISRPELKRFLEERVREEIKPEEIRIEEMLLKKFGFVPEDFDLRKTTIELYTEQAAAFYDFRRKRLFLLDGGDSAMEEAAMVHELAHALADQHFRLGRFIERARADDDAALARMAVMEGQATWLMAEFMARRLGRSLLDAPEMIDLMSRMVTASTGQFPVFDSAPLYIRESLMFPYTSGMKFQNAVLRAKGKSGFAEAFRNPPRSTREVLHPAVYLKPERINPPRAPRLAREGPYRKMAEGVAGEFDYAVLLRQYAGEEAVRRIAPGWRAGRYRLLEHKKDGGTLLLQSSLWADAETAGEFFQRYRDVLEAKWDTFEIDEESAGRITGRGDDGHFVLLRHGALVTSAEGLGSEAEKLK